MKDLTFIVETVTYTPEKSLRKKTLSSGRPSSRRKRTAVRQSKAARAKILKEALRLFSSQGFAETKMADIAKASGISVGTLYLRFKNKNDLCLALIKDQTRDFEKVIEFLDEHDPLNSLKNYITFNLEFAFKRRQLLSMFMREHSLSFIRPLRESFFETQHRIITRILLAGRKKGVFNTANCSRTASVVFASIRGVIMLRLIFGVGEIRQLSSDLHALITKGLVNNAHEETLSRTSGQTGG